MVLIMSNLVYVQKTNGKINLPNINDDQALKYNILAINGSTTSRGAQSMAFDDKNQIMYVLETGAISRYPMNSGVDVSPLDASSINGAAIGHQGLAVEYTASGIKLWSTGSSIGRYAARFDYTPNIPIELSERYGLFESGIYANNTSCTPTVSNDGKYLIAHGTRLADGVSVIRVWDLPSMVETGAGNHSTTWRYQWETDGIIVGAVPMQGTASDGNFVYLVSGTSGFGKAYPKRFHVYTMTGELVYREDNVLVGRDEAWGDLRSTRYEPEGLSIYKGPSGENVVCMGILSGDPGMRRFRVYQVISGDLKLSPNNRTSMLLRMMKYFSKIRQSLGSAKFDEGIVLGAGETRTYDLTQIVSDHANYVLLATPFRVSLYNTGPSSPTSNHYINSEAIVTAGINEDGLIVVHNMTPVPITINVYIGQPTLRK